MSELYKEAIIRSGSVTGWSSWHRIINMVWPNSWACSTSAGSKVMAQQLTRGSDQAHCPSQSCCTIHTYAPSPARPGPPGTSIFLAAAAAAVVQWGMQIRQDMSVLYTYDRRPRRFHQMTMYNDQNGRLVICIHAYSLSIKWWKCL